MSRASPPAPSSGSKDPTAPHASHARRGPLQPGRSITSPSAAGLAEFGDQQCDAASDEQDPDETAVPPEPDREVDAGHQADRQDDEDDTGDQGGEVDAPPRRGSVLCRQRSDLL